MSSILRTGIRLISALRCPEEDKKHIVKVYSKTHRWEDVEKLCQGELVRKGFHVGVVVRQKSAEQEGIVAFIDASKCKWYYVLSYCPYLHEIAYDGSCGLVTNSISKEDGAVNMMSIEDFKASYSESIKNRSLYSSPADEHYFPAFDHCRYFDLKSYLPAINELLLLVNNKELFQYYLQMEKDFNNVDMLEGVTCRLWSSTDAQQVYTSEGDDYKQYSNAFAVILDSNGKTGLISTTKTEEAWCIPFCRF